MIALTSGSKPLKEYLKWYESNNEKEKKKKRKKKNKPMANGILVIDEDPVWKKDVNLEEDNEEDESTDEYKPQVDEDIEIQRVRKLEQLLTGLAYSAIAEDGSGWVSLSPKRKDTVDQSIDISPPRRQRARNDTPSPESQQMSSANGQLQQKDSNSNLPKLDVDPAETAVFSRDLSPRKRRLTPEHKLKHSGGELDLSPPLKQHNPKLKSLHSAGSKDDLSPRRRQRARNDTPEPELIPASQDMDWSPLWWSTTSSDPYSKPASYAAPNSHISPPRWSRTSKIHGRKKSEIALEFSRHQRGLYGDDAGKADLSPPRKSRNLSPQHSHRGSLENDTLCASFVEDLSPPRKNHKENLGPASSRPQPKTGLITGHDVREEIFKAKEEDVLRFHQMDPSISGRGAEPVYRDKKGERISKDEFLKSKQKFEEKPKEMKLEWGKGLAQKREAEAGLQEFKVEKEKPFARTRDDPELDKMMKERVRWGDPMAHLVKKKHSEPVLPDLGDSEKMKESGFIVPQDIPSHSWMKRELDTAPNRYGIKPGRHWDGVNRSNGFEKQMFRRTNEKQAAEREAYLWSVSDM